MELNRPSVSRDTRMLFTIIVIAVGLLWVLARIRFPDRAPTANPVPAVLAQLAPASAFDDIVSAVAQIEPRVQPAMVAIEIEQYGQGNAAGAPLSNVPALRFR